MVWDVFISHASEDKDSFVRPLAQELSRRGLKVWYDEFTFKLGDSLRQSIDRGLAESRFGIVVLSPNFFAKEWPQRELDGLTAREISTGKIILPVWHNINREEIEHYSPVLADRLGVSTSHGLDRVITDVVRAIQECKCMLEPITPATTKVTVTIDMELEHIDERYERLFQHALAEFLMISPNAIQVKSKELSNSVKITIELPAESEEELLNAYNENNPKLIRFLFPLKLLGISGEKWRNEVYDAHIRKSEQDDPGCIDYHHVLGVELLL